MKNKLSFVLLSLLSTTAFGASFLDSVERMKWGDMEVVYIEDSKFPRYNAAFYFQDGSINDPYSGLT